MQFEIEPWPSPRRISIYYARLAGRIEGMMFVRHHTTMPSLRLDEWESGSAPDFYQIGGELSRAHFTIFDDVGDDAPDPLRYTFHSLSLHAGQYLSSPVLCQLRRQNDEIIVQAQEASLNEIHLEKLF